MEFFASEARTHVSSRSSVIVTKREGMGDPFTLRIALDVLFFFSVCPTRARHVEQTNHFFFTRQRDHEDKIQLQIQRTNVWY